MQIRPGDFRRVFFCILRSAFIIGGAYPSKPPWVAALRISCAFFRMQPTRGPASPAGSASRCLTGVLYAYLVKIIRLSPRPSNQPQIHLPARSATGEPLRHISLDNGAVLPRLPDEHATEHRARQCPLEGEFAVIESGRNSEGLPRKMVMGRRFLWHVR